jgi:deferrochelatase/peroxidase EfeB
VRHRSDQNTGCPLLTARDGRDDGAPRPGRRGLLLGLAGGALGLGLPAAPARAESGAGDEGRADSQPFFGPHQAGVATPQPAAALFVSFDVLASERADLQRLFQVLTERIAFLMKGGDAQTKDRKFPPPDSGLLGPRIFSDNLTVTVALGASLFDQRFGLARARPARLVTMEQFPNDALDDKMRHGDVLLQFCANAVETNIHALRDILKHTPDLLAPRWKIDGFLPPLAIRKQETARNLLGFKDGTANLNSGDATLMDQIVWLQPDAKEPSWAVGGAYQVVRIIRMFVERWDRTALAEQQTIIGREKASGAPLSMADEHDKPDYTDDGAGARIPLTAHIRLANPRRPETDASRILRRGYNYSRGLSSVGQLDMGLIFVCFQSDLQAGFLSVQTRLNGEPLEEYIKPIGGGYFFVLPGVRAAQSFLGEDLLKATS